MFAFRGALQHGEEGLYNGRGRRNERKAPGIDICCSLLSVTHTSLCHCCCCTRFQTGEETFFKIKKTTKMQKVFETYAQRKGVQVASLRFLLDGEKINQESTPKMLELEDQDQIDCLLEQTGGMY